MNRSDAIQLNSALSEKELKPKDLSTDSYSSLHLLKVKLKKFLTEMGQAEQELFNDYGVGSTLPTKEENPGFWSKLNDIQKEEVIFDKLNFMEIEECKKFTNEVSFNSASIIAEFISK